MTRRGPHPVRHSRAPGAEIQLTRAAKERGVGSLALIALARCSASLLVVVIVLFLAALLTWMVLFAVVAGCSLVCIQRAGVCDRMAAERALGVPLGAANRAVR